MPSEHHYTENGPEDPECYTLHGNGDCVHDISGYRILRRDWQRFAQRAQMPWDHTLVGLRKILTAYLASGMMV